jgi:hypothetical protein
VIRFAGRGPDRLAATKTRSSSCRIPEIGRRMASPTRLSLRKQSSSRLAWELHLGMAASDARGPQFGEGPAIHFRLSRVRSLPGPTATGLYFTVLLCMLYSLHDGSARCFREASDWPLRRAAHPIGRRCSSSLLVFCLDSPPPLSCFLVCSPLAPSVLRLFALATKQATQYACTCLSSG